MSFCYFPSFNFYCQPNCLQFQSRWIYSINGKIDNYIRKYMYFIRKKNSCEEYKALYCNYTIGKYKFDIQSQMVITRREWRGVLRKFLITWYNKEGGRATCLSNNLLHCTIDVYLWLSMSDNFGSVGLLSILWFICRSHFKRF